MVMMEQIKFQDIYQEKISEQKIDIFFTLEGVPFYLITKKNEEGVFVPVRVVHVTDRNCPFCQRNVRSELTCYGLQRQRHALFQRLISDPKLRLFWVYVKHAEG